MADLKKHADLYNVEFNSNSFFPINTLNLMRGAIAAKKMDIFENYSEAIFSGIWVKDVNLGDIVRDEATQGLVNVLRTGSPLQAASDFLFATPPSNRTKRNVLSKKVDSSDPANKRAISVSSNGTILTSNR